MWLRPQNQGVIWPSSIMCIGGQIDASESRLWACENGQTTFMIFRTLITFRTFMVFRTLITLVYNISLTTFISLIWPMIIFIFIAFTSLLHLFGLV